MIGGWGAREQNPLVKQRDLLSDTVVNLNYITS